MSWLDGAGTVDELLARREPLSTSITGLRRRAAAAAPGRTGAIVEARATAMVHGGDWRAAFGTLTPAEEAVVAVVEQFVLDAHGIDDAMVARLGEHGYTPAHVVAILFHLALADGFAKFARVFDVPPSSVAGDAPSAAAPEEAR